MKTVQCILRIVAVGMFFASLCGCTANPFGEDKISSGSRQIRGNVQLHDGSSPEGVYVWLEGFNIGTYTDESGQFSINLPRNSNQGTSSGISGVFKLYFYIANYLLDYSQVIIQDGEFVYSRGDINKDGRLSTPKVLRRFLRINTSVMPSSVSTNYTAPIEVKVSLQATIDSATVIIPKSIGGLLGAILLKKTDSQEVFIYESVPGAESQSKVCVGLTACNVQMAFNLILKPLTPGSYEVIPYLLMAHEAIPEDLIESMGTDIEQLSPNYLKIPFRREGGQFKVY